MVFQLPYWFDNWFFRQSKFIYTQFCFNRWDNMFGLKTGKWRFECLECGFKTESHTHFINHAIEHYKNMQTVKL